MLSWYAVARAIETARAGRPRLTPMAAISVAFSACSVERSTRWPSSVTEQPSGSGRGPEPRQNATPTPTTTARTTRNTRVRSLMEGGSWGRDSGQLLCSAAFRVMPSRSQGRASMAPVTELRRNRTLSAPESSAALTTFGLESMSLMVTLVPAVT